MEPVTGIPVAEPDTPEEVARLIGDAAAAGRRLAIRGGGTKSAWGHGTDEADEVMSTRRLSRVLDYAESDLTLTCEAGVTLDALNRELARRRQWLPIESAFDGATVGGILATNDAGPLRHRYGTPRDLLIGIRLATADGKLVKAGGRVVKNVAGYDLGKLVTGSFGSLAAIVSATFKLTPLPVAFGTLRFTFGDRAGAAEAAAALAASQLDPLALDVRFHAELAEKPIELLARFGSTAPAVEMQMAEAERQVAPCGARTAHRVVGVADEGVWRLHLRRPWSVPGLVVRVSWLPASLPGVLSFMEELRRRVASVELIGRAGIGAGLLRVSGETKTQVASVRALRERFDLFNQATVLQAPPDVTSQLDLVSPRGSSAAVLAAVKQAFDPAGVFGAGQGLV